MAHEASFVMARKRSVCALAFTKPVAVRQSSL